MKDGLKYDHQLDLRGLDCVSPVVKLNNCFKQFGDGEIVEIICNDPTAFVSITVWARTSGNQVIEALKAENETRFYISKGGKR